MTRVFGAASLQCAAGTACIALAGGTAGAAYFIQPTITFNTGGFINGLDVDGATQGTQSFNNAPFALQSDVDLATGKIGGKVQLGGADQFGISQGRFGERVTFNAGGIGTDFDVNFAVEGTVNADQLPANAPSNYLIGIEAYIAVFDTLVGANSSNWWDLSVGRDLGFVAGDNLSLLTDRVRIDLDNPAADLVDFDILEILGGSLAITEDMLAFDVFANLTLFSATNAAPVDVDMDFLNTASFGINTAPGVTYTSDSGVFLNSTGVTQPTTVVPLPAALPLFIAGFGLLGLVGWRRRREA
jgi:hypothetical protein